MKKIIPNILTMARILSTPIVLYLGISNQFFSLIILAIFIALTDFFDGRLARIWNVKSDFGSMLDVIADKLLAFSLLAILIFYNHCFYYVLFLEICIALFKIYTYCKNRIVASLIIGKIKTWIIFSTIILGLINILLGHTVIPINLFVIITAIFQVASLIQYINAYIVEKNRKKNPNFEDKKYYEIVKPILESAEFQRRKDFPHHYNESVYTHVLRVSYDCYQIGKKSNLDYKALAIAGLLHDFYEKPWQGDLERKPLFQRHGFTHAENARKNALKFFPNLMNEKIESMIATHMFPMNKKIPEYKESWVLTLVDKADSIDFLFHPLLAIGRVRRKKK